MKRVVMVGLASLLLAPTVDRMLEAIGKSALGLDTAMFSVSNRKSAGR